jgi:hypothetical protein
VTIAIVINGKVRLTEAIGVGTAALIISITGTLLSGLTVNVAFTDAEKGLTWTREVQA